MRITLAFLARCWSLQSALADCAKPQNMANGWIITTPGDAGFGNSGQRLFLIPELDLSVVMTAGEYHQDQHGMRINQSSKRIVGSLRKP